MDAGEQCWQVSLGVSPYKSPKPGPLRSEQPLPQGTRPIPDPVDPEEEAKEKAGLRALARAPAEQWTNWSMAARSFLERLVKALCIIQQTSKRGR